MPNRLFYLAGNRLRDDHLEWVAANNASEPAVLIENHMCNSRFDSETINGYGWMTVLAGQAGAPDGGSGAIKLTEASAGTGSIYHGANIQVQNAVNGAIQHTLLAFKAGTQAKVWINPLGSNPGSTPAKIDLATATVITQGTGQTVRAVPVGDWVFVETRWTYAGNGEFNFGICNVAGSTSYVGDGTGFIWVWRPNIFVNRACPSSPIFSAGGGAGYIPDASDPFFQTGAAADNAYGTTRFPDSAFSLPYLVAPQAQSGLFEFVELGTAVTPGAGLMAIGNADQSGARLQLLRGTNGYRFVHHNGTASVQAELAAFPLRGQLTRLRWQLFADGSVKLSQSLDNGAETSTAQSSANALAGAWGGKTRWIGGLGPGNVGFLAYRGAVELSGTTATLADLMTALTLDPPVITSAATSTDGSAGSPFTFNVTASNTPTSFAATGLPAGLTINTATGVISGTPLFAGTSTVTLSATNAVGTGTQVFTLTLQKPAMPNYYRDVNFERLTGEAFFIPEGQAGQINLGNIEMHKLTIGAKGVTAKRARKGRVTTGASATPEVEPEWEFTINEKFRGNAELILGGKRLADLAQAAASALSINIASAQPLQTYSLGKFGVANVVVKKATTPLTLDVDYQLDAEKGKVTIMSGGAVLANDALTVEFDATVQKFDRNSVLTDLDKRGVIEVYEEDTVSSMWRNLWVIPCTLSPSEVGDRDPSKYLSNKLKATVTGMMIQHSRQD